MRNEIDGRLRNINDPKSTVRRVVHESNHYRIEVEDSVIIVTRSAVPFASAEDVEQGCAPVQETLDRLGRARHAILIDTRAAIARNDPEYEKWFSEHRRRMVIGFQRAVLLTKTQVGALQIRRLVEEDGTNVTVFTEEAAALAFAKHGPSSSTSRRTSGMLRVKV